MHPFVPVILAGGVGSRLWPLSRALYPKQLIKLAGDGTMLQETLSRLNGLPGQAAPIVVAGNEHRFMVAEQLQQLHDGDDDSAEAEAHAATILLEPVGRNTAPAVAVAALHAKAQASDGDDPILLVLPADHVITDVAAYHTAIGTALERAQAGDLVTFGIRPTHPETGYGYIQQGETLGNDAYRVSRFVEKPDADTAGQLIAGGDHHWNSGMFAFRAGAYLEALKQHAPEILTAAEAATTQAARDLDFVRLDEAAFTACPSESIDYAVMEHTANASVVPVQMGWSDLGSWRAVWEAGCAEGQADANNNVSVGDVISEDSSDCYVRAESRLVATVGVQDLVIVETDDTVMVAPKDRAQDVKKLVQHIKGAGRTETDLHTTVYRPWGSYTTLELSDRYQVKHITVKPGGTLSLQMHHHRAEHWIIVAGTARITRDDEEFLLTENQSTYIPLGTRHRLENPGTVMLEMVEVQSGSYLGEDDIVRFDDKYGREGTNT